MIHFKSENLEFCADAKSVSILRAGTSMFLVIQGKEYNCFPSEFDAILKLLSDSPKLPSCPFCGCEIADCDTEQLDGFLVHRWCKANQAKP